MNQSRRPAGGVLATEVTAALEGLMRLFRWLGTPADLSLTAVATLMTLERSGSQRLTWLAGREGVTQPGMTQLISRLQDSGLVVREADPADGRVVHVSITDNGAAMLASRRTQRSERLAGLLSQLSPAEQNALARALPAMTALTRLEPDVSQLTGPKAR